MVVLYTIYNVNTNTAHSAHTNLVRDKDVDEEVTKESGVPNEEEGDVDVPSSLVAPSAEVPLSIVVVVLMVSVGPYDVVAVVEVSAVIVFSYSVVEDSVVEDSVVVVAIEASVVAPLPSVLVLVIEYVVVSYEEVSTADDVLPSEDVADDVELSPVDAVVFSTVPVPPSDDPVVVSVADAMKVVAFTEVDGLILAQV